VTPFPARLAAYTAVLSALVVSAAVALAVRGPLPEAGAVLLFASLVVFAEHQTVTAPGNVLISASLMVGTASVVVFADQGALLGALLVGAASGIYLPSFHRGRWGWIAFNASVMALSYLAAGAVYLSLPDAITSSLPAALVGGVIAACAFVVVNLALIVTSYAIEGERSVGSVVSDLAALAAQAIPFALLGVFLGRLYLELGWPIVLLLVVPVLVAREMFQSYLEVRAANEDTLKVLIRALEAKDPYTAGHSERVARYTRYIGEEFRFSPWRLERLRIAALCHDIGKLVVPNHLLNKPGRLTEDEFARVRLHERVTVEMLSLVDFLAPVAPTTSFEAGRYRPDDPTHPIEPYMIAVADAFDAMTSTRAYRRALSQEVAFSELRDKAGTQFHAECVEALIVAVERRGELHGAGQEEDDAQLFAVPPPEVGVGSAGLGDLADRGTRSVAFGARS
jgi:hypothetical protein